jgi:hypothetical protein
MFQVKLGNFEMSSEAISCFLEKMNDSWKKVNFEGNFNGLVKLVHH